jgi:hypothetical protein
MTPFCRQPKPPLPEELWRGGYALLKRIRKLFQPKKAMAFVDYEYWFYSYKTRFGIRPNPAAWREELEKKYRVADVMVFADFSSPGLSDELQSLREMTNTIIETGDDFMRRKKDMTDFVMLDYIYQCANERKEIDTYLIFTGDGHFQSVVKYLIQKRHKKVILFGVADSFSKRLLSVATESVMLPMNEELFRSYSRLIIQNMAYCADHSEIIPTFMSTVGAMGRLYNLPADMVKATMNQMIEKGYLYQREQRVEFGKKVKVLAANWELLIQDGLWDPGV